MRANARRRHAASVQRFFREPVESYGVATPLLRRRAAEVARSVQKEGGLPLALEVGDLLYALGQLEETVFAQEILRRFRREFDRSAFRRFDAWLGRINNWASCDGLSIYLAGDYIVRHGVPIGELMRWARSRNRWRQRAAAVSLIPAARRGLFPDAVFRVADRLLPIRDDMVEKGVGWLLKDATKAASNVKPVIAYLSRNRRRASRLALRYACERLSRAQKRRVLG